MKHIQQADQLASEQEGEKEAQQSQQAQQVEQAKPVVQGQEAEEKQAQAVIVSKEKTLNNELKTNDSDVQMNNVDKRQERRRRIYRCNKVRLQKSMMDDSSDSDSGSGGNINSNDDTDSDSTSDSTSGSDSSSNSGSSSDSGSKIDYEENEEMNLNESKEEEKQAVFKSFYGIKVYDPEFYHCAIFGTEENPSPCMTKANTKELKQLVETYLWKQHTIYWKDTRRNNRVFADCFTKASVVASNYPELLAHIDGCTKPEKRAKIDCTVTYCDKNTGDRKVYSKTARNVTVLRYRQSQKEKLYFILKLVMKAQVLCTGFRPVPWIDSTANAMDVLDDNDDIIMFETADDFKRSKNMDKAKEKVKGKGQGKGKGKRRESNNVKAKKKQKSNNDNVGGVTTNQIKNQQSLQKEKVAANLKVIEYIDVEAQDANKVTSDQVLDIDMGEPVIKEEDDYQL